MDLFVHDWSQPPLVTTEWQTDVVAATETLSEERRGNQPVPRRVIIARWVAVNQDEAVRIQLAIARLAEEEFEVPLYPDAVKTTSSSSGTTINCVTADRRFYVGSRVVIFLVSKGRASNPQRRTITVVGPTSITVSVALTGAYAAGAVVCPSLRCRKVLDAELNPLTSRVVEVSLPLEERLDLALPGSCAWEDLTGFEEAYDAAGEGPYFVFDFPVNWRFTPVVGMTKSGARYRLGRDDTIFTRATRPRFLFTLEVLRATHADFFRLLSFFDAHRGRLIPFFVVSPLSGWAAATIATSYVEVAPTTGATLSELQAVASYVAVLSGGVSYVRSIVSIALVGANWRITIDFGTDPFPALSVGDVDRVKLAHLVRFRADSLEEEWVTNEVMSSKLTMEELVDEAAYDVDDKTWTEPPCVDA